MACFCPTTRSASRSSILTSFSRSPSWRRETGMPVQLETTSAMSSSVTSSLSICRPPCWMAASLALCSSICRCNCGMLAVLDFARLAQFAPALGLFELGAQRVELLLQSCRSC